MKKFVITIARENGSGGRAVGEKLARRLGVPFYNRDLLRLASDESGISEQLFARADEEVKRTHLFRVAQDAYKGEVIPPDRDDFVSNENLFRYQARVILELARTENCVIIGRCADYILRDRKDCLHVFICSDMASRARRIVERYGQTQKAPEKRLAEKDQKRKVYYKNYTGRVWGQAQNYDICLNSGALGVDTCTDMIVQLCK